MSLKPQAIHTYMHSNKYWMVFHFCHNQIPTSINMIESIAFHCYACWIYSEQMWISVHARNPYLASCSNHLLAKRTLFWRVGMTKCHGTLEKLMTIPSASLVRFCLLCLTCTAFTPPQAVSCSNYIFKECVLYIYMNMFMNFFFIYSVVYVKSPEHH